ncbi:hypothetical protein A2U01_0114236, partial [Trifolium medium]|nr:hypothetical protein [Trifolium medium]
MQACTANDDYCRHYRLDPGHG